MFPEEAKNHDAPRKATQYPPPPPPKTIRRVLRLVGWNVLFLVAGLVLIGVVGEMYFRLRAPFVESDAPYDWSPIVGSIFTPQRGGALDERA